MAILKLPIDASAPNYSIDLLLDGITFRFDLYWNDRSENWFLTIRDENDTIVMGAKKIATEAILNAINSNENAPPGDLISTFFGTDDSNPGRNELGSRIRLFYNESE